MVARASAARTPGYLAFRIRLSCHAAATASSTSAAANITPSRTLASRSSGSRQYRPVSTTAEESDRSTPSVTCRPWPRRPVW
jgi:hypothetical protein